MKQRTVKKLDLILDMIVNFETQVYFRTFLFDISTPILFFKRKFVSFNLSNTKIMILRQKGLLDVVTGGTVGAARH